MSKWFEILHIEIYLIIFGGWKLFFLKLDPKFDFWNWTFLDLREGAKNTLRGGAHNAAAFGR